MRQVLKQTLLCFELNTSRHVTAMGGVSNSHLYFVKPDLDFVKERCPIGL